ncbi:phosphate signaling complex protein PhoU [Calderihabitans maritimus]|uniref:Phosphate-specific transport system accessory protein PhoU n=1 Tax=Calderihabitans maritimus TaxID=1246530 RepID=A0A1Z5HVJ8_9FIRM|nr:phosphate signaling complex protein PhoU [Calderihabitans maritimus]GAW93569.1 phosphate uptake regulator PhoU [Calderihabitans maritimus]
MVASRRAFHQELKELQQEILRMGSLVEEAIANAISSLARQDVRVAEKVINGDQYIDDLELAIEDRCIKLIATQQPMAKDLRRISAAFKIITDLERMGDYSSDIAKVTLRIAGEPLIKPLIDIPRMAELAQKMVKESLDSYVTEDPGLAARLAASDDQVDHLHYQVFRELLTYMMEDPRTIKQATQLLFVCRYLERIADHATNIGERVIYLVTGDRKDLND